MLPRHRWRETPYCRDRLRERRSRCLSIGVDREGAAALLSIVPGALDDLAAESRMPQPGEIGRW